MVHMGGLPERRDGEVVAGWLQCVTLSGREPEMAGRSGRGRRVVRGGVTRGKPSADRGSPMRMSRMRSWLMTRTQEAMVEKLGEGEHRVLCRG